MNARLPWLLMLPLMASGCLAAHSAAYAVVGPEGDSAHGYLSLAPLVLAIAVALGVVAALRAALGGGRQRGGPVCLFALLPPLAFMLQEHLEALLGQGAVLETALEPTFVVGLGLQLPFALGAAIVAGVLLRATRAAAALLVGPRPAQRAVPAPSSPTLILDAPRLRPIASRHAERAPPLAA